MAPNTLQLRTTGATLAWIVLLEAAAGIVARTTPYAPIGIIGLTRIIQILGILYIVTRQHGGLDAIGAARATWTSGIRQGFLWSAGFALTAGVAAVFFLLAGYNPMLWIKAPLPQQPLALIVFLIVGGLIAPIAEELCFRGILYTYFRKWGVLCALLVSTSIFVALHSFHGFPVAQITGGLVFALAYEISGKLLVPVTIHVLGNLAIFLLSLPVWPL
jgi:membrane protease YdiL (CAAX protease family)